MTKIEKAVKRKVINKLRHMIREWQQNYPPPKHILMSFKYVIAFAIDREVHEFNLHWSYPEKVPVVNKCNICKLNINAIIKNHDELIGLVKAMV